MGLPAAVTVHTHEDGTELMSSLIPSLCLRYEDLV